jgi:signal transduction histidine kinase
MGMVTLLWTLSAGVALTLVAVCGAVWLINRRDPASLMLCCQGVAVAASAYIELRLMHSTAVAEYGELLRWYHLPIFLALSAQILFVHYYLGTGRIWLLWTFFASRALIVVVNFTVEPNFNFSSITALHQVPLLGQQVTAIAEAVTRTGWQHHASANLLLWMAVLADASFRRWRMGDRESRRKALAVALGITIPMAATIVYSQLFAFGILRWPLSNLPWFLTTMVLMAIELGRDFVVSRRQLDQFAALQNQLAHSERVSMAGQLASTLIHELSQPLSATVVNARVALDELKSQTPDVENLRAILGDIDHDSNHAAEMVTRMRQFFKVRAIAMEPLRLADVVNDVAAMVRKDAVSSQVTLSLLIPADLPRVRGDRVHLSQVLLNLVMNAIQSVKTCPTANRRVIVEARADQDQVQCSIQDTGPGISQEIGARLFQPFVTTKPEGMGMGLSLSRSIIEAHGGRLWTQHDQRQSGAIFCFTLQRA